ncbi:MAG: helix-turn-helix domain containing protein [Prevotellaceae bacterium]|jgi:hypothetical protein|nr:helix-turn-helix domain containing protein [Prevotellaceae bacterium]
MPQAILPLFAEDMIIVSFHVGVQKRDGIVYYFQGGFPFYCHREDDRQSFKHVVCQLLANGMATRSEISRAFRIPECSISRWNKLFEENGEGHFFSKP